MNTENGVIFRKPQDEVFKDRVRTAFTSSLSVVWTKEGQKEFAFFPRKDFEKAVSELKGSGGEKKVQKKDFVLKLVGSNFDSGFGKLFRSYFFKLAYREKNYFVKETLRHTSTDSGGGFDEVVVMQRMKDKISKDERLKSIFKDLDFCEYLFGITGRDSRFLFSRWEDLSWTQEGQNVGNYGRATFLISKLNKEFSGVCDIVMQNIGYCPEKRKYIVFDFKSKGYLEKLR